LVFTTPSVAEEEKREEGKLKKEGGAGEKKTARVRYNTLLFMVEEKRGRDKENKKQTGLLSLSPREQMGDKRKGRGRSSGFLSRLRERKKKKGQGERDHKAREKLYSSSLSRCGEKKKEGRGEKKRKITKHRHYFFLRFAAARGKKKN